MRFDVLVLALGLASAPLAARAQPPDAVAQARQHFARGVKLYEEDDFRTALIEFNRAYELAPNWQVLYDVGQAHYQLRDYAGALATLERYVAAGGADVPKDRRQQVDRELEELRGRVAHVTFTSNAAGADVTLDDAPLGTIPFAAPVVVGAGRHRVSASKPGWRAVTKVVDVAGGEPLTIVLDLAELPSAPTPPAVAPAGPDDAPALVVGGIGLAGFAVGSIFGVVALGNKSTLKSECADKTCPGGTQGDIDAFERNGAIATVGFTVGAVGLGVGALLYVTAHAKAPAPQTGLRVTPWLSPRGAGLTGSF